MNKKYPVLKCTKELWNEIKPVLEGWGLNNRDFKYVCDNWVKIPYLISNFGNVGCVMLANFIFVENDDTRYLVNTKEEWLAGVAKLLGKEYPIKEIGAEMEKIVIGGIEIKPGMLVYTSYEDMESDIYAIVFPSKSKLCVAYKDEGWDYLDDDIKNIIVAIRDIHDNDKGCCLDNSKLLWEKPKKVTLTKQQIAEKFGIDIEQLDII